MSALIGDLFDVMLSWPTAPAPTTFAEALNVLDRYHLRERSPPAVVAHLQNGADGKIHETPKSMPGHVHNLIIGSNVKALADAQASAEQPGYRGLNLGSYPEGETLHTAPIHARITPH